MAELYVLDELRAFLIAQGIAQPQDTAPSTVLPSLWLNPRDGVPIPRAGENVTITLIDTNTTGPPEMEAWIEETFVDIIVRSRKVPAGRLVQRQIRGLLSPIGDLYGRKHWTMGSLLVEYSTLWRGDQPLAADADTYTRVQSFRFGVRRSVLST